MEPKKDIKKAIFLVILFALHPIIFVYSINLNEVSFLYTIPALFISLILGFTIFWTSKFFLQNLLKRGILTAASLLILWNFESLYALITKREFKYIYFMIGMFLMYGLFVFLLVKTKNKNTLKNIYTLTISPILVLIIFNLISIFSNSGQPSDEVVFVTDNREMPQLHQNNADSFPDFYLIILDEFATSKTIEDDFGHILEDQNFFKNEGFFVAQNTKVRYADTGWSLPTLLNLAYFSDPLNQETYWNCVRSRNRVCSHEEEKFRQANSMLYKKWGDNFLMKYLKHKGYFINVFEGVSKFIPVKFELADRHVSPRFVGTFDISKLNKLIGFDIINPFTVELINNSLFKLPYSYFNDVYITKHLIEVLKSPLIERNQPQFTLAHIVCPHPPYVFDSKGNIKPMFHNLQNKKNAYLEQYLYILNEIKEVVRKIKKQSNNEAVIVIQSDHGPRPHMANLPEYDQAFDIFNAVYFPDGDYKNLYDSIGQPNTLRVVLNKYFDDNFEMLLDK